VRGWERGDRADLAVPEKIDRRTVARSAISFGAVDYCRLWLAMCEVGDADELLVMEGPILQGGAYFLSGKFLSTILNEVKKSHLASSSYLKTTPFDVLNILLLQ